MQSLADGVAKPARAIEREARRWIQTSKSLCGVIFSMVSRIAMSLAHS